MINERIARLEAGKNRQSVDALLIHLRRMLNKTGEEFNKDEAFDILIDLKAAAATENHKDELHFQAVYSALKHKIAVPAEQFKKYLAALIGDKVQEKVLDMMAKVDKSLKLDKQLRSRHYDEASFAGPSGYGPRQRQGQVRQAPRQPIRCYYCNGLGHTQFRCYKKLRESATSGQPDAKRFRRDGPQS